MTRAIKKYFADFAAIVGLIVLALVVAGYIYTQQAARARLPFIEETPMKLLIEVANAQAVTPGQGQSIRVAGVQIGLIKQVGIQNGVGVVEANIDGQYSQLIHKDATALLRPRTGLKDMFIEVDPGTPKEPLYTEGERIPVKNTATDIDQDEILAALDTDTRAYLQLLVNGAGKGFKNHGDDFREILRRFEPLHRDLARIQTAVAQRRYNLRTLVHNYQSLTNELGDHDTDIVRLVSAANESLSAFANENRNVSLTIDKLAPALRQTQSTLVKVDRFSDLLGPTLNDLRPAFAKVDEANRQLIPLGREGTPILRDQVRPFVKDARPFVRDLRPAARDLTRATPELTTSFKELNRLFNMAAYNPGGQDPKGDSDNYLYWFAYTGHNTTSLFSTSDASGPFRRTVVAITCDTLRDTLQDRPGFAQAFGFLDSQGISAALDGSGVCPSDASN